MHRTVVGSENETANKTDEASLSSESLHSKGGGGSGEGQKKVRKDTVYQMRGSALEENEARKMKPSRECQGSVLVLQFYIQQSAKTSLFMR